MRNCIYLVLIFAIVFAGTIQAQTSEDRIQKLEKICTQQEQQIQKLQERLGVMQDDSSYKQYTEKIVKEYLKQPATEEDSTGITAGYENGFFVRAAEGNLELKFTGYVQSGLGIFENDTYDNNSFFLNGAYLNFDIYMLKDWHARIQIDFADAGYDWDEYDYYYKFRGGRYGTALRDAFIEYIGIPEFSVRIGQTHVPFTMRGQYGENEGILIGADPFILGWSHGRDLGFMLHGVIANVLGYKAGIFNGEGSNTGNYSDEFLMAAQLRFYYCGYKENPNSYIHIGFMRAREAEGWLAPLFSPWGRFIFSGTVNTEDVETSGWLTGYDAAIRFDRDIEGGHNIRVESEFMFSHWQRNWDDGSRDSWLHGWGFLFGILGRYCVAPDVKGSGILIGFNFSYSDIDNKESKHDGILPNDNNIPGQRAFVYTVILGYAFNKHISAAFNWVMMDLDNKVYYGTSKDNGKDGDLEHAWLFQVTAQW